VKSVGGSASLLLALVACGGERPKPPSAEPAVASAVARVADVPIPASLIASVAGAQGVSARSALDALLDDALAARDARDHRLDGEPHVTLASEVALARRVHLQAMADARTAGPPTPDELQDVTVVHAVIARAPGFSEDAAIAVANNVQRVVAGSHSAEDFVARVNALPWQHARLVAQTVGPFGIDGTTQGQGVVDPAFVAASFALRAPLQITGIVTTSFGWHVIQLVSRAPLHDVPPERRDALAAADIEIRTRMRLAEVLERRRERWPVEISHDAESLMAAAAGASP
jgi:hypothetical protein